MTGEHGPVQTWADGQRAWLDRWYRETRAELLPDVTGPVPAVGGRVTYAGVTDWSPPAVPGENDHLIARTDNSLRPDDPSEQPPQDPAWRPA